MEAVSDINIDFYQTLAVSKEIDLEEIKQPNIFIRLLQSFLKLFVPLL